MIIKVIKMGKVQVVWDKEKEYYDQIQEVKKTVLKLAKEISELEDMLGEVKKV